MRSLIRFADGGDGRRSGGIGWIDNGDGIIIPHDDHGSTGIDRDGGVGGRIRLPVSQPTREVASTKGGWTGHHGSALVEITAALLLVGLSKTTVVRGKRHQLVETVGCGVPTTCGVQLRTAGEIARAEVAG